MTCRLAHDSIMLIHALDRFPLFSKGVDTYRFEYGVFLLNKDIELVCTLVIHILEARLTA